MKPNYNISEKIQADGTEVKSWKSRKAKYIHILVCNVLG